MHTEVAEWRTEDTRSTSRDSMYVIVYNSRDPMDGMDAEKKKHAQQDGYCRTIQFVRYDMFMNWCTLVVTSVDTDIQV